MIGVRSRRHPGEFGEPRFTARTFGEASNRLLCQIIDKVAMKAP